MNIFFHCIFCKRDASIGALASHTICCVSIGLYTSSILFVGIRKYSARSSLFSIELTTIFPALGYSRFIKILYTKPMIPVKKLICVLNEMLAFSFDKIWTKFAISRKLIPSDNWYCSCVFLNLYTYKGISKNIRKLLRTCDRAI